MAFKIVVLFAALAVANAGLLHEPVVQYAAPAGHYSDSHLAHGYQSQDILRTHGGTVSHISKAVVSPHSSVHKSVKTVNTDGYKTLAYAAPVTYAHHEPAVVQKYAAPVAYAQHAPVSYAHHAPLAYAHHEAAPLAYHQHQPALYKSYAAPVTYAHHAPAYTHATYAKPVVHAQTYAAPAHYDSVAYHHQPIVKSVSPVVEAHSTKTVSYSPASAVSHFSFESPLAHYAW